MTTKFLTIKFAKFPNVIVMEFPRKNSVLGQFSVIFPLPNPLQNANFINIVVSASLIREECAGTPMYVCVCARVCVCFCSPGASRALKRVRISCSRDANDHPKIADFHVCANRDIFLRRAFAESVIFPE